jgi:hypothetical protein
MSEQEHKHEVRIQIDEHKYESPNRRRARHSIRSAASRRVSNFTAK